MVDGDDAISKIWRVEMRQRRGWKIFADAKVPPLLDVTLRICWTLLIFTGRITADTQVFFNNGQTSIVANQHHFLHEKVVWDAICAIGGKVSPWLSSCPHLINLVTLNRPTIQKEMLS